MAFTIEPHIILGFELPDTLYHNTRFVPDMVSEAQRPVVLGPIADMALHTKHLRNPPAEYHENRDSGRTEIVPLRLPEDVRFLTRTADYFEFSAVVRPDARSASVDVPSIFEHHRASLATMIGDDFNLSPELFRNKAIRISERVFLNMKPRKRQDRRDGGYTYLHYDNDPVGGFATDLGSTNELLFHTRIASSAHSTGFLKDPAAARPDKFGNAYGNSRTYKPEEIHKAPEGTIVFHSGAMLHHFSLPKMPVWNVGKAYQRVSLVVDFLPLEDIDAVKGVYDRNTARQRSRIAAQQGRLHVA